MNELNVYKFYVCTFNFLNSSLRKKYKEYLMILKITNKIKSLVSRLKSFNVCQYIPFSSKLWKDGMCPICKSTSWSCGIVIAVIIALIIFLS